jgi:molybdate transport system permease protein
MVQPLQNSFESIGSHPAVLQPGASRLDAFYGDFTACAPRFPDGSNSTCPHVGEFGVVLMIGGNIPGVSRVASVQIYDHVEALEFGQAHRMAAVMLIFSFVVLLALYIWRPDTLKMTRRD